MVDSASGKFEPAAGVRRQISSSADCQALSSLLDPLRATAYAGACT